MSRAADEITITLPRSAVGSVMSLSANLTDRMHDLLERNNNGALSPIEKAELETLVQMAEFGQLMSMALQSAKQP